jgi:hypothetical protein
MKINPVEDKFQIEKRQSTRVFLSSSAPEFLLLGLGPSMRAGYTRMEPPMGLAQKKKS